MDTPPLSPSWKVSSPGCHTSGRTTSGVTTSVGQDSDSLLGRNLQANTQENSGGRGPPKNGVAIPRWGGRISFCRKSTQNLKQDPFSQFGAHKPRYCCVRLSPTILQSSDQRPRTAPPPSPCGPTKGDVDTGRAHNVTNVDNLFLQKKLHIHKKNLKFYKRTSGARGIQISTISLRKKKLRKKRNVELLDARTSAFSFRMNHRGTSKNTDVIQQRFDLNLKRGENHAHKTWVENQTRKKYLFCLFILFIFIYSKLILGVYAIDLQNYHTGIWAKSTRGVN